jgi:hypothetical protein
MAAAHNYEMLRISFARNVLRGGAFFRQTNLKTSLSRQTNSSWACQIRTHAAKRSAMKFDKPWWQKQLARANDAAMLR